MAGENDVSVDQLNLGLFLANKAFSKDVNVQELCPDSYVAIIFSGDKRNHSYRGTYYRSH
jgi:hypothetical protein